MPDFNKGWSVASVFNPYGMYRYEGVEFIAHRRSRQLRRLDNQCTQAASVADCIRSLGYTVKCCWTEESGRYVIISIQNDMEFCYGSRGSGICNHCPEEHKRSYRYLAGHRTIYEEVDGRQLELRTRVMQETVHMPARRLQDLHRLENISGEIPWPEMKELIDNGCIRNMYKEGIKWLFDGVSTLGNTMPPDIVQALQDFRSPDANFYREPDYEFYIPPCMQELPESCPPPESANNHGGGAGKAQGGLPVAVAAVAATSAPAPATAPATASATAVPSTNHPSKNTSSSSDSSDSSDSEDD